MSLTVPKAGVVAGRSASVQIEAPQTGAAVAEFGAVMKRVGDKMEAERLDREAGQHRIEIARDLGQLRLEFEQMNDPEQIDSQWGQRVNDLRARYASGKREDGRDLVDPRHRDRVLQGFDDLANRQTLAIGARSIEARKVQSAANWLQLSDEIVRQSPTSDPDTRKVLLSSGLEQIADDLESNRIDPVEAEKRRQKLLNDSDEAVAIGLIDADPHGFLDRADAGEFAGMEGTTLERYRARAQRQIAADEKAAAVEARTQATARAKQIRDEMTDIVDVVATGKTHPREDFFDDPEVQAHPDYPDFKARYDLAKELPGLKQMTPDELAAEIAKEKAKPANSKGQAQRIGALEDWAEKAKTGWAKNAVDFAQDARMNVPDLPDFNPANPGEYATALGTRISIMSSLETQGYVKAPKRFSAAELEKLKPLVAAEANPDDKLQFVLAVAKAGGKDAAGVLEELAPMTSDEGKILEHAAGLVQAGAAPGLAREIFLGQQMQAQRTVNLPSQASFNTVFDEVTGGLFDGHPARAQILQSATALFAASAPGIDPEDIKSGYFADGKARELFATSISRALGATAGRDGLTVGGLQDVRGAPTVLPIGVPAQSANAAFDAIGSDLTPKLVRGRTLAGFYTDPDPRRLAKAGLSGAEPDFAPMLGNGDTPADAWEGLQPINLGGDRFVMGRKTASGGMVYLPEAGTGQPWQFSMKRLIAATAE